MIKAYKVEWEIRDYDTRKEKFFSDVKVADQFIFKLKDAAKLLGVYFQGEVRVTEIKVEATP